MKKLFLTVFAAAAFGLAAMAQEQDTTRTESNEFRRDPNWVDSTEMRDDMQQDRVLNESDSLSQDEERESTNYQNSARELRDSLRQDAEEAGNEYREDASEMRDSAEQDAERMGDDIESTTDSVQQDANELGTYLKENAQEAKQDAEQAGQSMQQGVQDAGTVIRQGSDRALDTRQAEEDRTRSSAQDQEGTANESNTNEAASASSATATPTPAVPSAPVEVVEDKEGPNNEVVYKFNDEMWYVDRETKQMVKAEESQLRDSKHKVIVHDGLAKDDNKNKRKKY